MLKKKTVKKYVIDTSAILGGMALPLTAEIILSPRTYNEIRKGRLKRNLDFKLGQIHIIEPSPYYKNIIIKAAAETNDLKILSQTDIEILALALQLNAIIVTDDYAIQNVARYQHLQYINFGLPSIKKLILWKYRCTGCLRYFDKPYVECPVCGSSIKRVRK